MKITSHYPFNSRDMKTKRTKTQNNVLITLLRHSHAESEGFGTVARYADLMDEYSDEFEPISLTALKRAVRGLRKIDGMSLVRLCSSVAYDDVGLFTGSGWILTDDGEKIAEQLDGTKKDL